MFVIMVTFRKLLNPKLLHESSAQRSMSIPITLDALTMGTFGSVCEVDRIVSRDSVEIRSGLDSNFFLVVRRNHDNFVK